MRIKIVTILALLSCSVANAQSIIDQVYKTISPEHERESYAFMAFDGQSKILANGNGISNVYDEKWNVLEKHNAGQALRLPQITSIYHVAVNTTVRGEHM